MSQEIWTQEMEDEYQRKLRDMPRGAVNFRDYDTAEEAIAAHIAAEKQWLDSLTPMEYRRHHIWRQKK